LSAQCADRFAQPELLARKLFTFAETLTRANRPDGQTAAAYTHQLLVHLGCGAELPAFQRGARTIRLLPVDADTAQ
jgi:hypothetical protein